MKRKAKVKVRSFQVGERVMLNEDVVADSELERFLRKELFVTEYAGIDTEVSDTDMYKLRTKNGTELPMPIYDFELMLY